MNIARIPIESVAVVVGVAARNVSKHGGRWRIEEEEERWLKYREEEEVAVAVAVAVAERSLSEVGGLRAFL